MFNYRYAFTTFTIVALLMLGYNWGFNTIHHEKQVFVFREVLKVLYNPQEKEIQYLNLDLLRSKAKCCSFQISSFNKEEFKATVLNNGWKAVEDNEENAIYKKNNYTLSYTLKNNKVICDISYWGIEDE